MAVQGMSRFLSRLAFGGVATLLVLTLGGCPWLRPEPQANFVSADADGGSYFGRFDDVVEGAPTDAEGEGGAERDVVEPDIIRRVGDQLFVLNQYRGLTIVDLTEESVTAQLPTYGYPRDLYIDGDRAIVLTAYAQEVSIEDGQIVSAYGARAFAIDLAAAGGPVVTDAIALDGDFVDSRLVDGRLCGVTATAYYGYYFEDVREKGEGNTTVSSLELDTAGTWSLVDSESFPGTGYIVHVTPDAVFVSATDYSNQSSTITQVNFQGANGALEPGGMVTVPGIVTDKFQLDAWNGALRVVSTTFVPERLVNVTTVDLATMEILANVQLTEAAGETLFATRFDGPRAYIVTFLVVDPLFVFDLSDPAAPVMLGELHVPGYSVYIEPQGDRLVALGVDDTDGRRVSVSLFDVSDSAFLETGGPVRLDIVTFGEEWSWSSAFSDVKALTILDDTIMVPFSGWNEFGGFDRLQFVSYTADDLALRGYVDLNGSVLRSFEYGEHAYGVTTEHLSVIDASDLDAPEVLRSVVLAEYVADIRYLDDDTLLETVVDYGEGAIKVRTLDAERTIVDEEVLTVGQYSGVYVAGDRIALVGIEWDETVGYSVAVLERDEDDQLKSIGATSVDVNPYFGYWWWWDYAIDVLPGGGFGPEKQRLIAPGPYSNGLADTAFVLGDTLALRCYATDVDDTFGDGDVSSALALVDLRSVEWTRTVGLAYEGILNINATDGLLYVGTKEYLGLDDGKPVCANYIRQVDILSNTEGPAANVPGAFVRYDAASGQLVLRDYQWMPEGDLTTSLNVVAWNGGEAVTLIDSATLPPNASTLLPTDSGVYFDSYGERYGIGRVLINGDGTLVAPESVTVGPVWGQLIGARGDIVYVAVQGAAIARYDFAGTPALTDLVPVMAAPSWLNVQEDGAIGAAGFAGVVELP